MQDLFWVNMSRAVPNSDNMAENNENPGRNLLEAANIDCPPPQTAEPTGPLAADTTTAATTAGRKRKKNDDDQGNEQAGKEVVDGGAGTRRRGKVVHIRTERLRRNKMRGMFSDLQALLPQLPPKADKATVVYEAVNTIKSLEETLKKLEKQKLERLQNNIGSSSVGPIINHNPSITVPTTTRSPTTVLSTREAFVADQVSANHQLLQVSPPVPPFHRIDPPMFRTWRSPNVVLSVAGENAVINVCCSKSIGLLTGLCGLLEKHKLEVVSLQVSSAQHQRMYMIHARANIVAVDNTSHEVFSFEEIFQRAGREIINYITSVQS